MFCAVERFFSSVGLVVYVPVELYINYKKNQTFVWGNISKCCGFPWIVSLALYNVMLMKVDPTITLADHSNYRTEATHFSYLCG